MFPVVSAGYCQITVNQTYYSGLHRADYRQVLSGTLVKFVRCRKALVVNTPLLQAGAA